jgi:hypothetical protein
VGAVSRGKITGEAGACGLCHGQAYWLTWRGTTMVCPHLCGLTGKLLDVAERALVRARLLD